MCLCNLHTISQNEEILILQDKLHSLKAVEQGTKCRQSGSKVHSFTLSDITFPMELKSPDGRSSFIEPQVVFLHWF